MITENETHTQSLPVQFLRLRAVVLALGESAAPAWWKTEFMNETGLRYLERLYPRTYFHAAVQASGKAATDAHDRAVGRVGVYHLFRLPESLETEIHRLPPEQDRDFFSTLRNALGQPDELLQLLMPLCVDEEGDVAPGAKKIGTDKDLMTEAGMRRTASMYYLAFAQKKPGYPYFTMESLGERE